MHDTNRKFKVLCPVQNKEGRTFWRLMGIAFPNSDGSTNIILDGLPVNGKLQLREWDDAPWKKEEPPAAPSLLDRNNNDSTPF